MSVGGWVSPSDHARAIYDNEGGAIPEVPMRQWRPQDAPAFGAEYADQITEQVRIISQWIDGEVERGATDALVAALREKGWKIIKPESRSSVHIEAGARVIRSRVANGIDWDDGAAWMDTLRAALDAAERETP